jgi:hypothetical protein
MSWSKSVYSEMVSDVGYDTDTGELLVTFKRNGRTAAYADVPEAVAEKLSNAPSVGNMLNNEIKGVYPFRYV